MKIYDSDNQERQNRMKGYQRAHEPAWKKNFLKYLLIGGAVLLAPCIIIGLLDPRNWIWIAGLIVLDMIMEHR